MLADGNEYGVAEIVPELIVILVPSTLTAPKTDVVAVGITLLITPLPLMVIVVPSILTPPDNTVLAVGNVYPGILILDWLPLTVALTPAPAKFSVATELTVPWITPPCSTVIPVRPPPPPDPPNTVVVSPPVIAL